MYMRREEGLTPVFRRSVMPINPWLGGRVWVRGDLRFSGLDRFVFVVVTYDVAQERLNSVRRLLRRYLLWMQNSVFEGNLTEEELDLLILSLKRVIDGREDSIFIYTKRRGRHYTIDIGRKKGTDLVI